MGKENSVEYCPACGYESSATEPYCPKCGASRRAWSLVEATNDVVFVEEDIQTNEEAAAKPAAVVFEPYRSVTAPSTELERAYAGRAPRPEPAASLSLLDAQGRPIEASLGISVSQTIRSETDEAGVTLRLSNEEFERLSRKTSEILTQATLAHQRVIKDQEEIEQLKTETRETLRRLRAA